MMRPTAPDWAPDTCPTRNNTQTRVVIAKGRCARHARLTTGIYRDSHALPEISPNDSVGTCNSVHFVSGMSGAIGIYSITTPICRVFRVGHKSGVNNCHRNNHACLAAITRRAFGRAPWQRPERRRSVMPIPVDPRPDLRADSMLWERLMSAASPELAGALHGLRCLGTRLIRTAKGYTVRPDPDALADAGWTYTEIRDTYLAPHTSELVRLMADLGRVAS